MHWDRRKCVKTFGTTWEDLEKLSGKPLELNEKIQRNATLGNAYETHKELHPKA